MTLTNQQTGDSHRGLFWLILSYLCGTIVLIAAKHILNKINHIDFFCWFYGTGLFYHILYAVLKRNIVSVNIEKKHLRLLIVYVILDLTGTCSFFLSLAMMDPPIISFLNQSQIIFASLLGFIILNEVLNSGELGAAGIIIVGIFIMTYKSVSVPLTGTALMLYANFTGSVSFIIVRKIGSSIGTLTLARIRNVSLVLLFLSYNFYTAGKITVPPMPLLVVIFIGSFFGPFLNVISIYNSLKYIPVGKLALLRSIQPVFVMIAAWVFLNTFPGIRETLGGMIVLTGTALLAYFYARHLPALKQPVRPIR